jgi:hypothetical protein
MKTDQFAEIPWDKVHRIVLRPRKRQACIVYSYPNYKGVVKTFSLGFNLKENYEPFVAAVREFIPDRVADGKLRMWNSPPAVAFCIAFVIYAAFLLILAGFNAASGH